MDDELEARLRGIAHGKPLPTSPQLLLRIFDKVREILAEFDKAAKSFAVCVLEVHFASSLDRLDSGIPPDWSNPWSSPFDPPVSQIAEYLSEAHVRDLLIAQLELEHWTIKDAAARNRGPENRAVVAMNPWLSPEWCKPVELNEARRLRLERLAAQNAVFTHRKNALDDLRQRVEAAIEKDSAEASKAKRGAEGSRPRSAGSMPTEVQLEYARKLFRQNPKATKDAVRNSCSCGSDIATKIIGQMRSEGLCESKPRRKN